jgi:hypothetical protein
LEPGNAHIPLLQLSENLVQRPVVDYFNFIAHITLLLSSEIQTAAQSTA